MRKKNRITTTRMIVILRIDDDTAIETLIMWVNLCVPKYLNYFLIGCWADKEREREIQKDRQKADRQREREKRETGKELDR